MFALVTANARRLCGRPCPGLPEHVFEPQQQCDPPFPVPDAETPSQRRDASAKIVVDELDDAFARDLFDGSEVRKVLPFGVLDDLTAMVEVEKVDSHADTQGCAFQHPR
jgi:hypothetical protein